MRPAVRGFARVLAQTDADARAPRDAGGRREDATGWIETIGNVKFDADVPGSAARTRRVVPCGVRRDRAAAARLPVREHARRRGGAHRRRLAATRRRTSRSRRTTAASSSRSCRAIRSASTTSRRCCAPADSTSSRRSDDATADSDDAGLARRLDGRAVGVLPRGRRRLHRRQHRAARRPEPDRGGRGRLPDRDRAAHVQLRRGERRGGRAPAPRCASPTTTRSSPRRSRSRATRRVGGGCATPASRSRPRIAERPRARSPRSTRCSPAGTRRPAALEIGRALPICGATRDRPRSTIRSECHVPDSPSRGPRAAPLPAAQRRVLRPPVRRHRLSRCRVPRRPRRRSPPASTSSRRTTASRRASRSRASRRKTSTSRSTAPSSA